MGDQMKRGPTEDELDLVAEEVLKKHLNGKWGRWFHKWGRWFQNDFSCSFQISCRHCI